MLALELLGVVPQHLLPKAKAEPRTFTSHSLILVGIRGKNFGTVISHVVKRLLYTVPPQSNNIQNCYYNFTITILIITHM